MLDFEHDLNTLTLGLLYWIWDVEFGCDFEDILAIY